MTLALPFRLPYNGVAGKHAGLGRPHRRKRELAKINRNASQSHIRSRRFDRLVKVRMDAMPEPTLPLSHDGVRSRLERAVEHFAKISEPGRTVFHALSATHEILCAACEAGDLSAAFPDLASQLSGLTAEACPVLAKDGAMSPERAYWGLGRTNELLIPLAPSVRAARISHVAIFAAEMSIAMHRRQLMLTGHEIFEDFLARSATSQIAERPNAVH